LAGLNDRLEIGGVTGLGYLHEEERERKFTAEAHSGRRPYPYFSYNLTEKLGMPGIDESLLRELRDRLAEGGHRLVLVESCTAGLVAACLGQIPGISQYFCGSWVVYREASKQQWLGIDQALLEDPHRGPVCQQVTELLAKAALDRTPEATIAAAITGHLGPAAPSSLEGKVYSAIQGRESFQRREAEGRLSSPAPRNNDDWEARRERQTEATHHLLRQLLVFLQRSN
jgi:nicotinamide-nucleotide amidase